MLFCIYYTKKLKLKLILNRNHLGKLNTTQNDYAVLVLTERFKGKYVTIKYHTIKQCESY